MRRAAAVSHSKILALAFPTTRSSRVYFPCTCPSPAASRLTSRRNCGLTLEFDSAGTYHSRGRAKDLLLKNQFLMTGSVERGNYWTRRAFNLDLLGPTKIAFHHKRVSLSCCWKFLNKQLRTGIAAHFAPQVSLAPLHELGSCCEALTRGIGIRFGAFGTPTRAIWMQVGACALDWVILR